MKRRWKLLTAAVSATALAASGSAVAQAGSGGGHHHWHGHLSTVVDGLEGPRGVDALPHGMTVISESDGSFSLVVERRNRPARVVELGSVAPGFAPAVAVGPHGKIFVLTGAGAPDTGAATLYVWKRGWDAPKPVADIGAYQQTDPDPYNLEGDPGESNPFGLAALRNGSVLVADAAGNDLLRVRPNGDISTVARLKPRTVEVPDYLPEEDPEGNPLPPAGTMIPAEAVATSVTVGADGNYYVGELRGFPATPGTSQIWRIKAGAKNAVCNPERPWRGPCKRHARGLTSIVDLAAGKDGAIYALSLSKKSWLAMEVGVPGAEIGGLFRVGGNRHHHQHHPWIQELVRGKLTMPGGVDVIGKKIYVTQPIFGEGSLLKVRLHHHGLH